MSRPAKLSPTQCVAAIKLRGSNPKRWTVTKVAKKYKVSEASMYKVLNGSYVARKPGDIDVTKNINLGTPSIFGENAQINPPDDVLLAAAQVIVSRSKFANMLRHM